MRRAIASAARTRLEAVENRTLLSAYTFSQPAYFGSNGTGAISYSSLVADSHANRYGTTFDGGAYGGGTVFEIAASSTALTTLASFDGSDGLRPEGRLTVDASGNLYGTTSQGGANGDGIVFEVLAGSATVTTLASFNGTNGADSSDGVALDSASNIFGTTDRGGVNNKGVVYEIAAGSGAITALTSFSATSGSSAPYHVGPVILDASGNIYGTTPIGGTSNSGTVFEIASGSSTITTLASFNGTNGSAPDAVVIGDATGDLFGTTGSGGTNNLGTIFEWARGSSAVTTLVSFNGSNGSYPRGGLILDAAGNFYGATNGTVFEIASGSASVTTLASFDQISGTSGVMLDTSGNLFGTTSQGGPANCGTVFEVANGSNVITTIAAFSGLAVHAPQGDLVLDSSGNLYGLTQYDGANGLGTVYEIAKTSGALTTLASFNGTNGANPYAGSLIFDAAGDLYGTTFFGGTYNDGTVFEIARGSNTITTLASFNRTNGQFPQCTPASDAAGNLYGTTLGGGANGFGTVFEVAKDSNAITVLASFSQTTGAPYSGVTLDPAGNLYGTTASGGASNDGTVFEIAKGSNALTTLVAFNGTNGQYLDAGVTLDPAGNLYGATRMGGADNDGTVFEIAHGSTTLTTLASFNGADGSAPYPTPTLDAAGNLYGTTYSGGVNNLGTVFEVANGSSTITTLISFNGMNGENPELGAGVTLDPVGNLYGATANGGLAGDGAVFELATNTAATLALTQGSNPSAANQPLTFTAAVTGGAPDGETVTLVDATNRNAAVATGTLAGGSATLTVPAGTLSVGTHNLVAVYGGDADYAASESAAYAQVVRAAPPMLIGAPLVNGDNPNGLFNAAGQTTPGQQRSMVEDIVYTFNEPVIINDANAAFTLAVAGPAGGTLPATLYAQAVANSNGTQWAVSLTGMPEGTIGSIANGEYSITINPAYVFAAADGVTSMAPGTGRTDNFYRLYGDVFGTESVTNADYNLFKKSINTYNPAFDDFGTGTTSSNADYNVFKKDLNISYYGDGFVTSI